MQIDMIEVCKLSLNKSHELDQKQKSFESRYEIHFHSQCETWLSWAPMAPFHGQVPGAKVHLNQTKEEEEENQSTKKWIHTKNRVRLIKIKFVWFEYFCDLLNF